MYDDSPTLRLFRGGTVVQQLESGLGYLQHLIAIGHAIQLSKARELELQLVGCLKEARAQEEAAADPAPDPVRAKPWWLRFGGGRI